MEYSDGEEKEEVSRQKSLTAVYSATNKKTVAAFLVNMRTVLKNIGKGAKATKFTEFRKQLMHIPEEALTLHGLGAVVKNLGEGKKMPRSENLRKLLERLIAVAGAICAFHETGEVRDVEVSGDGQGSQLTQHTKDEAGNAKEAKPS